MNSYIDLLKLALPAAISVAGTLSGIWIGSHFSFKNEKNKRNKDFKEKQISEFYGPISALERKIRVLSTLRVEIDRHAENASKIDGTIAKSNPKIYHEYDERQMREIFLPLYKEIIRIIDEKGHYADRETLELSKEIYIFVEIWERHLGKNIDSEVIKKLKHTEDNVKPFYDKIHSRCHLLMTDLSEGK